MSGRILTLDATRVPTAGTRLRPDWSLAGCCINALTFHAAGAAWCAASRQFFLPEGDYDPVPYVSEYGPGVQFGNPTPGEATYWELNWRFTVDWFPHGGAHFCFLCEIDGEDAPGFFFSAGGTTRYIGQARGSNTRHKLSGVTSSEIASPWPDDGSEPLKIGSFDFDGATMRHYDSGVEIASTAYAGTPSGYDSQRARLGARDDARYFHGKMYAVWVFNRSLTPGEVARLHAYPFEGYATAPIIVPEAAAPAVAIPSTPVCVVG
jgi:hypothetical protein